MERLYTLKEAKKVRSTLPTLPVVLLLGLSVVATAQGVPMDAWEIIIESDIPLSADVKKGIEGAAEYIVREVIPEWEECASIRCICRVMEQEGEIYRITMTIDAEHTNGETVYAKVLFEYNAGNGEYVVKEAGITPTTTDDEVPPPSNATSTKPTADNDKETPTAPPLSRIGVSLWSRFELSKEAEKGIKDAAEQLVRERINVEELGGGVVVDCFILRSDGEWYTVYARVFAIPLPSLPGSPEASQGEAKAWEAAFKYNSAEGAYEVTGFSEVDNFLVPEDVEQKAVMIGEEDEEIKAFVTENAENNLTLRATWINRDEEVVRLEYAVALLLNETHALYKGLTAYIDVEGEEVLHTQTHEGVWYAPGLREGAPPPGLKELFETLETGTSTTTTDAVAGTPVEYYYGLGAILVVVVAVAAGTLLAIRKAKH